jgi:hypothetical protein
VKIDTKEVSCRHRLMDPVTDSFEDRIVQLEEALRSVDGHLRAIIVLAKAGSELEAAAKDARMSIESALGRNCNV